MSEPADMPGAKDRQRTPASAVGASSFILCEPDFVPQLEKVTSVAVFAFTDGGELVAVVEQRGPDLPGGHMEEGERSFEETARRESREEAGIELCDLRFLRAIESDFYGKQPDERTYMVIMTARVAQFGPEPGSAIRLVLSPDEFKTRHTALRKELLNELVDAAVRAVLG